MMCRNLMTLRVLSAAVGALVTLALCNEMLKRLDAQQEAARRRLSRDTEETGAANAPLGFEPRRSRPLAGRSALELGGCAPAGDSIPDETAWLVADSAQRGLGVERDGGSAAWMAERN